MLRPWVSVEGDGWSWERPPHGELWLFSHLMGSAVSRVVGLGHGSFGGSNLSQLGQGRDKEEEAERGAEER